jgi:WS/DGAT/MGAT family acyltransferase
MRQLSGVDAMHVLEETGRQHMHTIKIAILGPRDGQPVAAEEIRTWAHERLPSIPPMRWKVLKIPLGLGRPVFIDAGHLDVDRHLAFEPLPAPGDDVQFDELVSRVTSSQLPRDRPLWQLTVVEGMSGGRVGLIFKLHHAIMDGQASVRFLELAFDGGEDRSYAEVPDAEVTPTRGQLARFALRSQAAQYRHLPAVVRRSLASARVNRALKASGAPMVVNPLAGPSTRFNQWPRSDRVYSDVTVEFSEIHEIRNATGATINEVFVTLCGGAIRRYLAAKNELPDRRLTCALPISLRAPEEIDNFGNRTSYWYVALGTDIEDPIERLAVVKSSLDAAKAWAQGDAELFAVWQDFYLLFGKMTLKGLTAVEHLSRRPAFNAVVSNVRGPKPLALAGAPVVAVRSMGPITRTLGLNLTGWSYGDTFSVGMQSCREFMPDLPTLGDHLREELTEFGRITGQGARSAAGTD